MRRLIAATLLAALSSGIGSGLWTIVTGRFSTAWFNVKSFGALGDGNYVFDGVTNGTTTVTSASANFKQVDVGKTFFGEDGGGTVRCAETTIASVTNSTTAILTLACSGSGASTQFAYGHPDTAAIAAADVAVIANGGGNVYFPKGVYLCEPNNVPCISAAGVASFGVYGDGSGASTVILTPNSTVSSSHGNFVDFASQQPTLIGMGFSGLLHQYAIGGGDLGVSFSSASPVIAKDVFVQFWGTGSNAYGISLVNEKGSMRDIRTVSNIAGLTLAGVSNFSLTGENLFSNSVFGENLTIASTGPASTGGNVSLSGMLIDECGCSFSMHLSGALDVLISDSVIYGGASSTAVVIDGTSSAQISNSQIIPFDSRTNSTGLQVSSGGVVNVVNSKFVGSGTGSALNNAGTFNDNGGNSFTGGITNTGTILGPTFQGAVNQTVTPTNFAGITLASSTGHLAFPSQVGYVKQTAQSGNISATTLFTTATNDTLYSAYLDVDCATTQATETLNPAIIWTDTSNTVHTINPASTAVCTALGSASIASINITFQAKAATNIQYSVTTGVASGATYNVRAAIYQLGLQ